MSAPTTEVAAICRRADSAWSATCALLDLAEAKGIRSSASVFDDLRNDDAESVRESLEPALYPPGGSEPSSGATYNANSAASAVSNLSTTLTTGELSYVVASVLDEMYWRSFTREWLADRGREFDLCAGDRYPVGEMRLMGSVGHSARPYRLGLPDGELAHVRRRGDEDIRVVVNGNHPAIMDDLMNSPPVTIAALLPNESWSQLTNAPNPIGPADANAQQSVIVDLLNRTRSVGAKIAVLPELSVDENIVKSLHREWAGSTNRPILFAGSTHLVDGGRRVNRTTVLLPGIGAAWTHDKSAVFVDRKGNREPIDPGQPCITLGCGEMVRIATLICKDALSPDLSRLVADLGVHLLTIPAMSNRLGDFSNIAHKLIERSQGATVVANNPRLWDGANVEHALLGHPVSSAYRVRERHSSRAPDISIARLGGRWESLDPDKSENT